jgi:hypothetical protein
VRSRTREFHDPAPRLQRYRTRSTPSALLALRSGRRCGRSGATDGSSIRTREPCSDPCWSTADRRWSTANRRALAHRAASTAHRERPWSVGTSSSHRPRHLERESVARARGITPRRHLAHSRATRASTRAYAWCRSSGAYGLSGLSVGWHNRRTRNRTLTVAAPRWQQR